MPHLLNNTLVPIDTSWFDADPEAYLTRPDFLEFQELAGIDLRDLFSSERPVVEKAQQETVSQSKICSEIRREHSGHSPPFLYYTHDIEFAEDIPRHNMDLDKQFLAMSQGGSLRRRHVALAHAVLPSVITELSNEMNRPIRIKNLGSGVGLDVINAVRNVDGRVDDAWQYDINATAIRLGGTITGFLENENEIPQNVIRYSPESFLAWREPADLVVMVGVICGLNDRAALTTLKLAHRILGGGGSILSVAAGPIKEIEDVLGQTPNDSGWQFLALDHDIKALRWVKSKIDDQRLSYGIANAFQIIKRNYKVAFPRRYSLMGCDPKSDFGGFRKFMAPFKYRIGRLAEMQFDLIYSAGLYDYILTFDNRHKGAIALTTNLFQLLKPGGRLVIGNFSPNNPPDLRFAMEYLYDWVLIYRDEKEMYRLADGIPESDIAEMTLLQEPLGINYFLKIVKRG